MGAAAGGVDVVNTFAAQVIARSPARGMRKRALTGAIVFDLGAALRLQVPRLLRLVEWTARWTRSGSARRCRWSRSRSRSGSRSSRSRRSRTSSTSTAGRRRPPRWATWRSSRPSSRTWSPGRSCARTSCCRSCARPRDPRDVLAGPAFLLIVGGLIKKTVIADELARRDRRPGLRRPLGALGAPSCCSAFYGFAIADLLRLLRLHRHGHRPRAAARLQAPAELRPPYLALSASATSGGAGT